MNLNGAGVATFTYTPTTTGSHSLVASYSGDGTYSASFATVGITVNAPVAATITGQGTVLSGQEFLGLNVVSTLGTSGASYNGSTLSFSDSKANLQMTAVSITSVAFVQATGSTPG